VKKPQKPSKSKKTPSGSKGALASGQFDDSGEISAKRIAILREKLLSMQAFVQERMSALKHMEMESHDKALDGDDADVAEIGIERMNRQNEMVRLQRQFSEIRHALSKMESGVYGYCEESGEPISFERLLANPVARLSIEAQERSEHGYRSVRAFA